MGHRILMSYPDYKLDNDNVSVAFRNLSDNYAVHINEHPLNRHLQMGEICSWFALQIMQAKK